LGVTLIECGTQTTQARIEYYSIANNNVEL